MERLFLDGTAWSGDPAKSRTGSSGASIPLTCRPLLPSGFADWGDGSPNDLQPRALSLIKRLACLQSKYFNTYLIGAGTLRESNNSECASIRPPDLGDVFIAARHAIQFVEAVVCTFGHSSALYYLSFAEESAFQGVLESALSRPELIPTILQDALLMNFPFAVDAVTNLQVIDFDDDKRPPFLAALTPATGAGQNISERRHRGVGYSPSG